MIERANESDVLEFVNGVRAEVCDAPPLTALPKGKPKSGRHCPVARALTTDTVVCNATPVSVWLVGTKSAWIEVPPSVGTWMAMFDIRHFPELIGE